MKLFGREREEQVLRDALDAAGAGRGQLIVLAGEPGIGKTRLCEALEAHAGARGGATCWAQGVDGAPALYPWIQLGRRLARLAPGAARGLAAATAAGAGEAAAGFAAALREAGEVAPLVVVFDDVHAADPGSLRLLQLIAGDLRDARVLVVAAHRPAELRARPEHAAIVGELAHRSAAIELGPIAADACAALLRELAGAPVADAVVRRAAGHPLFARELAADLAAGGDDAHARVPHAIVDLVAGRLALLSAGAQRVVCAAAVIRDEAPAALIAAACALALPDVLRALDEAIGAGLADPDAPGDRLRFRLPLVRDAVYAGIRIGERAPLHRAIAVAAAAGYAAAVPPRYAELARHATLGAAVEDLPQVARYERLAGEQAAARRAWAEAAAHLARALAVRDHAAPGEVCAALLALGEVELARGDAGRGGALHAEAIELARARGDAGLCARVAVRATGRDAPAGADARFVARCREALGALADDEPVLRGQLLGRLAAREPRRSRELAQQARALIDAGAAPAVRADVLLDIARALDGVDELGERLACATAAEVAAASAGADGLRCEAIHQRVHALIELADLEAAAGELARCEQLANGLGLGARAWALRADAATLALARGELATAERLAEEAARAGDGPEARTRQLLILWRVRRAQHRLGELAPRLAAAAAQAPGLALWPLIRLQATPDEPAARAQLQALADHVLDGAARDAWWLASVVVAGELATALGDAVTGQRVADALAPYAARHAVAGPGGVSLGSIAAARQRLAGPAPVAPRIVRPTTPPLAAAATVEPDGPAWVVRWGELSARVPDGRGMRYLAELVREPDRARHVGALVAAVSGDDADDADGAAVPAAVRTRLAELAEIVDEAERAGSRGRALEARAELERITDQLAGAARDATDSPARTTAERQRQRVTKRVREAIKKIAAQDRRLGRHLEQAVRTGMSCVYAPIAGPDADP